jgi:hypothetical protein
MAETTPVGHLQMEASKVWGEENKRWKLFISHFYGCELCWGAGMAAEQLAACHAGYMQHYEFAYFRFQRCAVDPSQSQSAAGPALLTLTVVDAKVASVTLCVRKLISLSQTPHE